jgi:tRNA U34 5-methylaminomethyl-2-thiouridine-forming methyltransferase MnmC
LSGLIKTQDGSYTLEHSDLDATYHSTHGALTESQVVFIKYGFEHLCNIGLKDIKILEIGFGSGLNALLTLLSSIEANINVDYTGIEYYPVGMDTVELLGYPDLLGTSSDVKEAFLAMHRDREVLIVTKSSKFNGRILVEDFFSMVLPSDHYDLIYFDAFGPGVQPELWNEQMSQNMYATLRSGGVLTTYCVQGAWRRHLKTQGFDVIKLPGPPGKREVMRAVK